jgi:hypothetical protein
MTVIIDKKLSSKEIKQRISKMLAKKKSNGLKKYFGLSNEKINALAFQKKARNEWG